MKDKQRFEIISIPKPKAGEHPVDRHGGSVSPSGQYELALSAFEEIGFHTGSVKDYTKRDIVFQKSKTLIHTSEMSLLAKKVTNLCHFLAGGMGEQELYVINHSFFNWMLGYSSRNLAHLRKALVEAQRATVELAVGNEDSKDFRWVSVQLLSTAAIGDGEVRYRLPPEMRKEIYSSSSKAYLSMRVQSSLTVEHAMTIYEIFSGFDLPCTTEWMTPEEFREAIGITHLKSYAQYKALRRDVIDKALRDINSTTDIHIECEVASRGKGRAITHIRFIARKNENYMIGLDSEKDKIEMQNRYKVLTEEFGLSDKELEVVMSVIDKDGGKKVDDAIEFAKFRVQQADPPIKYPGAFLMSAITEGRRLSSIERTRAEKAKSSNAPKERAADNSAEVISEKAKYDAAVTEAKRIFSGGEFTQLLAAFAKTLPGKHVLKSLPEETGIKLSAGLADLIQSQHGQDSPIPPDPAFLTLVDDVLMKPEVRHTFGQYLVPRLQG